MSIFHGWSFPALLAAVLAVSLAVPRAEAASCEPDKLATKYPSLAGKTLKVGQDGESQPFSFRDPADFNKIVGLDADTARAVFDCAGVPIEFTIGSWSGLIPAAIAGQIDVMWDTLLYTPERAKQLDFVYYMHAATGMIVAKGNPHGIHSLTDLCGLKATAGLGTTQEAMLRDASAKCASAGKNAIEIMTSSDIPSGLRLVESGRADVLATNKFLGDRMVAAHPGAAEAAFSVTTGAKIAAGTKNGNDELVRAIFDGLTTIEENGTLKKIFDRYKVDYGLVVKPEILTQ